MHPDGAGTVSGNFGAVPALRLRAPPLFSPSRREENHAAVLRVALTEASAKLRVAKHMCEVARDDGQHSLGGQTRRRELDTAGYSNEARSGRGKTRDRVDRLQIALIHAIRADDGSGQGVCPLPQVTDPLEKLSLVDALVQGEPGGLAPRAQRRRVREPFDPPAAAVTHRCHEVQHERTGVETLSPQGRADAHPRSHVTIVTPAGVTKLSA